ncbi:AAA family ATPase [Candidatus Woesearchaeota archaeon]|nr:MAG: AAA family ATPase [Candidatus Woesearchaeota archaeon]
MPEDLEKKLESLLHRLPTSEPNLKFSKTFYKGYLEYKQGNYDIAIAEFTKAKNKGPNTLCDLYLAKCHSLLSEEIESEELEHQLNALKHYKSVISSGAANETIYHETLDLIESIDPLSVEINPYLEAARLCETAVKVFYDSEDLHYRLYEYYYILGKDKRAENVKLNLASFADINFIIDNFGEEIFEETYKKRSMYDVLVKRLNHKDEDAAYLAYKLGDFINEIETHNDEDRDVNRNLTLKYFKLAHSLKPEEYSELLPSIQALLSEGVRETKNKKLKDYYKSELKKFYKSHKKFKPKKVKKSQQIKRLFPKDLASLLGEYVIEQEDTVKRLAIVGSNHIKRINALASGVEKDLLPRKKLLLVHGPTGCGKTYSAQKLAQIIGVPVLEYNASGLTESGYVGDSYSDMFELLLKEANNDMSAAQQGIILVDEFDKLAAKESTTKDVSGAGAQKGFLKLIEGTTLKIFERSHSPKHFDTTNVTFILMGSFAGLGNNDPNISQLDRIVYHRLYGSRSIGFSTENKIPMKGAAKYAKKEDFIAFGIMPEIMGRVNKISYVHHLTKKDLRRMLTEPKDNLVASFKQSFLEDNILLNYTNGALDLIAEIAAQRQGGGRSLAEVMECVMEDFEFYMPGSDENELLITKKIVSEKVKKLT